MYKLSKKMLSILVISFIIMILPITVNANGNDISIIKMQDNKQEYMVYISGYTNKKFKYALSNNANPTEMDLTYINSITDSKENSAILINAETYEKLKSNPIYIWAKDENENLILNGEILNLENSITKENLKLIEETTQTISVEIADNKEKAYEIKNETVDGIKKTISVGTLKITDKDSKKSKYYYERVNITDSEDYLELTRLAEELNNEYGKMNICEKIQFAEKYYTLYSKLISNVNWKEVTNLTIEQPESSEESSGVGEKYIVFLKKVAKDGEETTDVQFLQEYYDYQPNVEKEKIVTKETAKLPITYDSIMLIVILAIVIIAIVIVFIRMKKLENKDEQK